MKTSLRRPIHTSQSVTLVIVNSNSAQQLPKSINALELQPHKPAKVLVVYNISTDDSLVGIKAKFTEFECVLLCMKIGFAQQTIWRQLGALNRWWRCLT